jgi:hypothetical protein
VCVCVCVSVCVHEGENACLRMGVDMYLNVTQFTCGCVFGGPVAHLHEVAADHVATGKGGLGRDKASDISAGKRLPLDGQHARFAHKRQH